MSSKNKGYYFLAFSQATLANPEDEESYNRSIERSRAYAGVPHLFKLSTGLTVCGFAVHDLPDPLQRRISRAANSWRCWQCESNIWDAIVKSGPSGPLVGPNMCKVLVEGCTDEADKTSFDEISTLASEIFDMPVTGITFEQDRTVGGAIENSGQYHHFSCRIPSSHMPTVNRETFDLIQKAYHRYIPQIFPKLIETLLLHGVEKAILSLKLLEECLKKANYGYKFTPTVDWLIIIANKVKEIGKEPLQMSSRDRIVFYTEMLLLSPISKDNHDAVSYYVHTAKNNILDLLENPNISSPEDMTKLVESRLAPETFQRRDPNANISAAQLSNAITALGDFSTSVITRVTAHERLQDVIELFDPKFPTFSTASSSFLASATSSSLSASAASSSPSASSAVYSMLADKIAADKNASGKVASKQKGLSFAERAGIDDIEHKISKIKSLTELIDFLTSYPNTKLELQMGSISLAYLADSDLDKEKLKYPHMWAFPRYDGRAAGYDDFEQIQFIVPMFRYIRDYRSVFFIPFKNFDTKKYGHLLGNCCFPVFLSSSYTRTCGPVFDRMNTCTRVKLSDEPLMIGVGNSAVSEIGKLMRPMKFRVRGVLIDIDTL